MGSFVKIFSSDCIDWKELNFESLPVVLSENLNLKNLLNLLENVPNENEKKQVMEEIVTEFKKSATHANKQELRNTILSLFSSVNSKKVLRKHLQDLIKKSDLYILIIKSFKEEILDNMTENKHCNIKICNNVFNFINAMQNTPSYDHNITIEHLFCVYYRLLEGFVYHLRNNFVSVALIFDELCILLNAVLKQLLSAFVKPSNSFLNNLSEYSFKFVFLTHQILLHKKINFDLKTKAGLVLVHSCNTLPENYLIDCMYRDCPALEFLYNYYDKKDHSEILNFKLHSDDVVILYSSIFNVMSEEKLLKVTVNDQLLISVLYHGLLECAKNKTSVAHAIVEISRTLSILSKHLVKVPENVIKPLFIDGLSYAWSHVEHFVDSVRTYARLFFTDLVLIAAYHKEKSNNEMAHILMNSVKNLEDTHTLRLLAFENMAIHMGCDYLLNEFTALPTNLLRNLSLTVIAEQVCKTYIVIMEKHFFEITNKENWLVLWVSPVIDVLKNCEHCVIFCQNIILRVFQLYPVIFRKIFPKNYIESPQECVILLQCLRYARNNGIELDVDSSENGTLYWKGLIEKTKLEKFIVVQDEEIKISALSVITECQKSTEMFTEWEFEFLCKYIHYNITSQIPSIRNRITSFYKKAFTRFNAGYYVIERNISVLTKKLEITEEKTEIQSDLEKQQILKTSYNLFIKRFTKKLISNLTFDSNYPRRATSLELLLFIQSFMPQEDWLSCWSEGDIKLCHQLLFDGYESIKKMAVTLLKHLPVTAIGFRNCNFTLTYMQQCLQIATIFKPNDNLSGAYLLEVCAFSPYFYEALEHINNNLPGKKLNDPILNLMIMLTDKLISECSNFDISNPNMSVYGLLLGLRHLLGIRDINKSNETCASLFQQITVMCLNLKDSIMPVVCNPSPEGYLPELDVIIPESKEASKSQTILVFAWRTIKEMTHILAEMVRQSVKLENTIELLKKEFMVLIGDFFITIFIEAKHRGVFEQAYVAFGVMCDSFWRSSNSELNSLPQRWLQEALDLCTGAKHSDMLCATRRSCGLPFLILAILTAEPTMDKLKFHSMINILFKTCENTNSENIEYRTHCLNVLRATFRHSRLGEIVTPFIGTAVITAIKSFSSDDWGIRNSATLLFAALMTRMFGVQRTQDSENLCIKNRLTVRVFFLRYPELFQFLLDTLAQECNKNNSLMLHPVLMILARLYPSYMEEYNLEMEKYLPYLETCLANQTYRTRELAARASIPLIRAEKISSRLYEIFSKITIDNEIGDNECHGLLLQVLHILKSNPSPEVFGNCNIQNGSHILLLVGKKYSHMTASLYMEVLLLFLSQNKQYDDFDCLINIVIVLSRQIRSNVILLTAKSSYPQMRMLLLLYITINKLEKNDLTYPTIANHLMCQLYGQDPRMKRFCLNFLIYLNQKHNKFASNHALFKMEEIEIPREIITLVNNFDGNAVTSILTHIHQYLKCFMTEELRFQHYLQKNDQVLLFLLVNYYPCVIRCLNLSDQETLDLLIKLCNCDNEELISAVISCISTYFFPFKKRVLKYHGLIKVLMESASPAAKEYRRLAVSEFLSQNYDLFCSQSAILKGDDLHMVLNIVMVLLEDDDLMIRNSASLFATNLDTDQKGHMILESPERVREEIILYVAMCCAMKKDRAICFLFSWACRHFSDSTIETSGVFEKGELNQYAENVPFVYMCAHLIYRVLWSIGEGLSFKDKSIFIEEQTLLVTTTLLDSLIKYPLPMMLHKTKVSVICALKSTVKFLENCEISNNFADKFRSYLYETILGYLEKNVVVSDFFNVRMILLRVYKPVFNPQLL